MSIDLLYTDSLLREDLKWKVKQHKILNIDLSLIKNNSWNNFLKKLEKDILNWKYLFIWNYEDFLEWKTDKKYI